MKKLAYALPLLGLLASTSAHAQFFAQIAPVTTYSTIVCSNFVKEGADWKSVAPVPFTLGIIRGIIPPVRTIKIGSYIYNNVDLASQLDFQCGNAVVIAKY